MVAEEETEGVEEADKGTDRILIHLHPSYDSYLLSLKDLVA